MRKIIKLAAISLITTILTTITILIFFKGSINIVLNGLQNFNSSEEAVESMSQLTNYINSDIMDYKDIVYKNTNNSKLTLDIYSSKKENKNGSPVIIYVHGGSWIYGDKGIPRSFNPIIKSFCENGFTIISVSYELLKNNLDLEKPICDIKDVIRWVYKNKDIYNINTNEIGLMGISSGAHLALLASYSDKDEFIDDKDLAQYPSNVKYVIDIFGPTDLSTLDITLLDNNMQDNISSIKNLNLLESKYSPINYVNSNSPSTFIVHSKNDTLVPYSNSIMLYRKLTDYNVKCKLLSLKETKHDFTEISEKEVIATFFEMLKFLTFHTPL
ncbi:alpha/beta hydrolase [Clostridium carnis]